MPVLSVEEIALAVEKNKTENRERLYTEMVKLIEEEPTDDIIYVCSLMINKLTKYL